MISSSSIVVASKEQVSCDLNGESVILNFKSGTYYGLNPVGSYIWSLIQNPKTVGQVEEAVLEHYEVDPSECERDLLELLNELSENELVKIGDEADK
jgi:hypothetical protein